MKTLHTAFVVSSFLLNCVSDYRFNFNAKSCPINRASFLSTLSFWWYNSLIALGKSKGLQESDLWDLNEEFQTRKVYNDYFKQYNKDYKRFKAAKASAKLDEDRRSYLEKELDGELSRARGKKVKEINILWPFFRTFKYELLYAATYKLISILASFAQPLILDLILRYIRSEDPVIWKGYFYAFGMFASSAVESILNNQYEIGINEVGMKLKAAMTVTIYKKSLVLSSSGRKGFTTGEIVNLMGIDIQKLVDYLVVCNQIWSSAIQIVISTVLIWQQLGLATIAGIAVMILMMLPNGLISNRFKVEQAVQMTNKDGRTKTLNEALSGIKVLKVYAWTGEKHRETFEFSFIEFSKFKFKSSKTHSSHRCLHQTDHHFQKQGGRQLENDHDLLLDHRFLLQLGHLLGIAGQLPFVRLHLHRLERHAGRQ